MKPVEVLASVCQLIANGQNKAAQEKLTHDYPGPGTSSPQRGTWSMTHLMRVFLRDGFTDRYSGNRLVFPGTLRALSILLPDQFPYHRNWKQDATHPAFYELCPTLDHVVPLARGGTDRESNVVTTSMLHNSAKANWLVEELGWPTERAPIAEGWDGLLGWFLDMYQDTNDLRQNLQLKRWHDAATKAAVA